MNRRNFLKVGGPLSLAAASPIAIAKMAGEEAPPRASNWQTSRCEGSEHFIDVEGREHVTRCKFPRKWTTENVERDGVMVERMQMKCRNPSCTEMGYKHYQPEAGLTDGVVEYEVTPGDAARVRAELARYEEWARMHAISTPPSLAANHRATKHLYSHFRPTLSSMRVSLFG